MAEATLMPTSTKPSASRTARSVMRERTDWAVAAGTRLSDRRADQLGDRAKQIGALDGLRQRSRCPGLEGSIGAASLAGVEMPRDRDDADSGLLLPQLVDRHGAAGSGHVHVGDHHRRRLPLDLCEPG